MGRIITDWYCPEITEELKQFMKSQPDTIWFIIEKTFAGNRTTIHVYKVSEEYKDIPESRLMLAQTDAKHIGSVDLISAYKPRPRVIEKLKRILSKGGV